MHAHAHAHTERETGRGILNHGAGGKQYAHLFIVFDSFFEAALSFFNSANYCRHM